MAEFRLLNENELLNSSTSTRSLSLLSLNEKWFFNDLSPDVSNRILANTPLHTCFLVTNSVYSPNHYFIFVKHNKDDLRKIEIVQISPGHFQIAKSPTQTYTSLLDAVYSAKEIHFKDVPPIFDRSELTPEALEIYSILTPPTYDEVLQYQVALKDLPPISSDRIIRPIEAADEDLSYQGGAHNRDDDDVYYRATARSNWFVRLIEQRYVPGRRHWDLRSSGYLRIAAILIFFCSTLCIIPHVLVIVLTVLLLIVVCLPVIIILFSCCLPCICYLLDYEDD